MKLNDMLYDLLSLAKQENERKKAVQILHEAEEVTPDEETLFEVNEEPIE